jgi:hypothetical protein
MKAKRFFLLTPMVLAVLLFCTSGAFAQARDDVGDKAKKGKPGVTQDKDKKVETGKKKNPGVKGEKKKPGKKPPKKHKRKHKGKKKKKDPGEGDKGKVKKPVKRCPECGRKLGGNVGKRRASGSK